MAISKFTPQSAKKDTGRTIGDNEVAKLANLNKLVNEVNNEFANFNPGGGGLGTLDIIANGSIGGPNTILWGYNSFIPAGPVASVSLPVFALPSCTLTSNTGTFTATSVEFPTLEYAQTIGANGTTTLVSISAPLLKGCYYTVYTNDNSALTTVSFPSLTYSAGIYFGNTPLLTNVNFSALVEGQLQVNGGDFGFTGFRTAQFPALRKAGFNLYGNLPFFEVDFPLLTELTGINGGSSLNLNSINLPGLVKMPTYIGVNYVPSLTNAILGTVGVTKNAGAINTNWNFNNCALNQASVDNFFQVLASLDGTNGTTLSSNGYLYLNGGSNASPSSAGLAAKSVLQSRGWYIANN